MSLSTPGADAEAAESAALVSLIRWLRGRAYRFVTPTPATHARVLARDPVGTCGRTPADIFGWSRPFEADALEAGLLDTLRETGLVVADGHGTLVSRVRVSSLRGDLFVHSAFPTDAADAVFLGPDSYRFAALIARELARCPDPAGRLLDIGTGAGVGAIVAARACPDMSITMTDINPRALAMARANMAAAGLTAAFVLGGDLGRVEGELDVVLANPPYIMDDGARHYRHGGGLHGAEVALTMARQATAWLAPDGRFILYTGSAIVDGRDGLKARLAALADARDCALDYAELDPDVFGEELDRPAYRDVERIALVSAVMRRGAA